MNGGFSIIDCGSLDNLSANPQKFVHSWLPFLTRFKGLSFMGGRNIGRGKPMVLPP
jgi:hypothetical protein